MSRQLGALIFWLSLVSVATSHAQVQGEITGEVTDGSGAVMPGVAVTVTNENTNVSRQVLTNAAGVYSFPSLLPGMYRVRAEMNGFQTMVRSGIELQVQQVARIEFHMQVGQVNEVVNVTGEAALLTTETATTGTVIENKRIVDLPLNGRNFLQLVALAPNVSYGFGTAGQQRQMQGGQRSEQNISVAGQRSEFNRFTLDGIENTDQNFNSYVFLPSIDALQEFKVQTGVYPAEFGRATSQVNVSTKSGANAFHGSVFEFFRNEQLDANNYRFVATDIRQRDPFVRNQYGYVLAGPVWIPKVFKGKDRLFFMTNYEGLRDRKGSPRVSDVPSKTLRDGDFAGITSPQGAALTIYDPLTRTRAGSQLVAQPFPSNRIPQNRFHPKALSLLQFYPLPNIATTALTRNYQVMRVRKQDGDQFNVRLDFAENSNSNWFGRWSWGNEADLDPGTFPGLGGTLLETNVQQSMLSNTRVLRPNIVNEFRFGYNRFYNTQVQENAYGRNIIGEIGGLLGVAEPEPILYGAPSISITGFSGFGDATLAPNVTRNHTFQWIDNMSIVQGRHSIRFGTEIRRERVNQTGNQFPRGTFGFAGNATQNPASVANTGYGLADYLLGLIRTSSGALGLAVAQLRAWRQYYYIDDVWKIRQNLTLNFGLRYEYSPPYVHKHGGLINTQIFDPFDPARRPVVVRAGSGDFYEDMPFRYAPGVQIARDGRLGDALVITDYNDFAPRIGMAYSPTRNWSIRSGVGVFYTQDIGNARYDMARNLSARRNDTANNDFPNLSLDAPFASVGTLRVDFPLILSNNVNRRTPYVFQYLFNVQRQISQGTLVEVGYTGNQGHKLERFRQYNQPLPGPGNVQDRRPYPELGVIQMTDGVVNSNYHALATKFQTRMGDDLTTLVSYTFSKAIDTGSAIRTHAGDTDFPQDNYDIKGTARGVANYHQKHRLVTSLLWEPPFGKGKLWLSHGVTSYVLGNWQIGTILSVRSGLPYTMSNGNDDANVGGPGGQYPYRTAAPLDPPGGKKDPALYFNKAAFARINDVRPFTYGNVGRNTMVGPEAVSWDFSTMKRFPLPMEGHELQFRFEAFNFPNRPNFATPNATITSNTFAQISSTSTLMREIQFSLKYSF
jgi:hypothetical protein